MFCYYLNKICWFFFWFVPNVRTFRVTSSNIFFRIICLRKMKKYYQWWYNLLQLRNQNFVFAYNKQIPSLKVRCERVFRTRWSNSFTRSFRSLVREFDQLMRNTRSQPLSMKNVYLFFHLNQDNIPVQKVLNLVLY